MTIYLDYNATAPIRPEAAAAVAEALEIGGNPLSVHAAGRAARAVVEGARLKIAALIGSPGQSVVFTSGGTEANALAIASAAAAGPRRMIISAAEHDSVLASAQSSGAVIELWPVDHRGVADLDWLADRLATWPAGEGAPFVALMLANNETGVIQPIDEVAVMVRAAGGWLHVDAVQAAGKIDFDFRALGADTLALSAHKLGGPQGVGALAFGPRTRLSRQIHGGGQERGLRAGTENVAGIAGFGAAAEAARRDLEQGLPSAQARDAVAARLKREAGVVVLGEGAPRLANTLCFAARDFGAELQVMQMDLAGVMVSAGSACSSGKVKPSHVVEAMGRGDLAPFALRISSGWATPSTDWDGFAEAWLSAHAQHSQRQSARQRQPAA